MPAATKETALVYGMEGIGPCDALSHVGTVPQNRPPLATLPVSTLVIPSPAKA